MSCPQDAPPQTWVCTVPNPKTQFPPLSRPRAVAGTTGHLVLFRSHRGALRGRGRAGVSRSVPSSQRILEDKEEKPLPAALVQPHTGTLRWFLDEAAARLLSVPFEKHSTL